MYIVYILYSSQLDRYYTGYTSGAVEQRLSKHLADHKGFTAKAKDWIIVYTEKFQSGHEAIKRERQIKNWKSRERILQLIMRSSTE